MSHTIAGLIWYAVFFMAIGSAIYIVSRRRNWSYSRSRGHVMSQLFYYIATAAIYLGLLFVVFGSANLISGNRKYVMFTIVAAGISLLAYLFRLVGRCWIDAERQRSD